MDEPATRIIGLIGFMIIVAPALFYALRNRRAALRNLLLWAVVIAIIAPGYLFLRP